MDAGGHESHIHCSGQGSPVVILEAALGSMSAMGLDRARRRQGHAGLQHDRAGLGWSEAGDGSFEPSRVPEELRVLLITLTRKAPSSWSGTEGGALERGCTLSFCRRHGRACRS